MISKNSVRKAIQAAMGAYTPKELPYDVIASYLTDKETECRTKLSAYGYIMYLVEHMGYKSVLPNMVASTKNMDKYVEEAIKLKADMPVLMVNAFTYASKIMANVSDMETCLHHLEGMSYPYVLYILFASSGQEDVVKTYKKAAAEQIRRYPGMLDLLGYSFKAVGEGLKHEDT